MGEVYLAWDSQLHRTVALKVLPADLVQDRERLHRFEQEAVTASALNHPNILTIHEVGQQDGVSFIATEYVDGQTLRRRLGGKVMKVVEVLEVAVQAATALSAAHQAGIVHRDVKPENIMLRPDGYIKVLDFGLAKLTQGEAKEETSDPAAATRPMINTEPGAVMGTVAYMSPEQAQGSDVDARTDIWSLGVVLYEMLTGRVPFEGPTNSHVIVSIIERDPLPLAHHRRGLPPELQRIVRKTLRKDREERYQAAKDLLLDLKALRREVDLAGEEATPLSRANDQSSEEGVNAASSSSNEAWKVTAPADELSGVRRISGPSGGTAAPGESSRHESFTGEIKRHRVASLFALAMLVILLTGFAYGVYKFVSHGEPVGLPPATSFTKLTTTGKAGHLTAISPDAKYVVYSSEDGEKHGLRLRQLRTSNDGPLVDPDEIHYTGLAFSPDGEFIYYVKSEKDDPRGSGLYQVPLVRGPARRILDVDSHISFSPDGAQFAFIRHNSEEQTTTLFVANSDGSGARKLTTRKEPEHLISPSWSPDGKSIACGVVSQSGNDLDSRVMEVEVGNGAESAIPHDKPFIVRKVAWLSDGSGLVVLGHQGGSSVGAMPLWFLPRSGGEMRRITNDLNRYYDFSLSADSKVMAAVQKDLSSSLWVVRHGGKNAPTKIESGVGLSDGKYGLAWTPDDKIAYSSNISGGWKVLVVNPGGSDQTQLMFGEGGDFDPTFTPDGRYMVFVSDRSGTGSNIWRANADGSNPVRLTSGYKQALPHCSPDGKWVVYISYTATTKTIWKIPIEGGTPVQLTDEGAAEFPAISPDGKFIAYTYADRYRGPFSKINIIPFEGGEPVKTFEVGRMESPLNCIKWSPDGRAITFVDTRGDVSNIWSQPVGGGKPTQLTYFETDQITKFDWSRDGQQLVLARSPSTRDVVLISNSR